MSSSPSNEKVQEPTTVSQTFNNDSSNSIFGSIKAFSSKWFLSYKLIYFVLNMYIYAFHTVQTLLFKSDGWELSYGITGLMSTVLIGNYFGGKMWGKMADRTGRHKEIIAWTTLAYTLLGFFMCFPEYIVFSEENFLKGTYPNFKFFNYNLAKWLQIMSGWVLFFFFSFFLSSAFPLTDRLVIGMLATNPTATKDSMGLQRLFGAFGHLLISVVGLKFYSYSKIKDTVSTVEFLNKLPLVNLTNDSYGKTLIFLMQVVSSALFIGCIFLIVPKNIKVPKKAAAKKDLSKTTGDKDFVEEEVKDNRSPEMILLSNPSFLMFILFVLCSGLTRCVTANYGKLIIEKLIGAKGANVIRDAEAARCITEVLAYATSPFIKKSLGIYWVLVMSQGLSVGRMIAYGLVPKNPNLSDVKAEISFIQYFFIMSLELAKGFTSGFISSSAIPIAHNMAPAGCETSAQTLYSGVYSGLSSGLGGLICWIYMDGIVSDPTAIENTMDLNYYLGIFCGIVSVAMIGKFIFVDRVMGFPGYPARKQV